MFNIKKYKFGFDVSGLILFLLIMLPNFIWFAVPAGNDILRNESITPVIDMVASIVQVVMVAALCLCKNLDYHKPEKKIWIISIIVTVILYYLCWCLYYCQIVNAAIILLLCVVPCASFIIFSLLKKNGIALVLAVIFMICHVAYGCINFVL